MRPMARFQITRPHPRSAPRPLDNKGKQWAKEGTVLPPPTTQTPRAVHTGAGSDDSGKAAPGLGDLASLDFLGPVLWWVSWVSWVGRDSLPSPFVLTPWPCSNSQHCPWPWWIPRDYNEQVIIDFKGGVSGGWFPRNVDSEQPAYHKGADLFLYWKLSHPATYEHCVYVCVCTHRCVSSHSLTLPQHLQHFYYINCKNL